MRRRRRKPHLGDDHGHPGDGDDHDDGDGDDLDDSDGDDHEDDVSPWG